MKHIIFVHLFNDYSGSPLILSQVIQIVIEKYHCSLITNKTKGFLSTLNIIKTYLDYKWSKNKILTLLNLLYTQLLLFGIILKKSNKNTIVYINTMWPFGAAIAAKIKKSKVIFHIHETSIKPNILKYLLKSIIYLTSDKILFVSNYLALKECIQGKEQSVIYNALPSNFESLAQKHTYNGLQDPFIITMACSLKEYKGINEYINIAFLVYEQIEQVEFNLVINASKYEVDKYFRKTKLPNNIKLFSVTTDMFEFYRNTSLLCNLSIPNEWIETFGMTILEAMAFGIPCIVPPVGGPIELIEHGINGYHYDSRNIHQIAVTIITLFKDRELLMSLSKNAKKKAQNFSNEVFRDTLLGELENL